MEVAKKLLGNDEAVLSEGVPHQFDEEILINGERRIYSCIKFPLRDEAGIIYGLAGISTDITESKRNLEALKETGARLEALINAIPDMVIFKDKEFRHLLVNRAAEKMMDRNCADVASRTNEEVLPPVAASMCRASDEQALTTREPVHFEESMLSGKGEKNRSRYHQGPYL